jgi:nucleotide-binding universal stress UspA family protein
MTIVCGTDFSAAAAEASTVAALVAKRLGEPLSLVHVIEDLGAEIALAQGEPVYEPERQRMARAAAAAQELGASVEAEVVAGAPVRELAARARGATLIVVGHLGSRMPSRWLVGSTAERLVRIAPAPVLVVRAGDRLTRWLRGEGTLTVALGVDRTETSRGTARWLSLLTRLGSIELVVVHVAAAEDESCPVLVHALQRDLGPDLAHAGIPDERVSFVVGKPKGDVDAELVASAENARADVLVVGSHQRSGIERLWRCSVARGVVSLAQTNVIVVPSSVARSTEPSIPVIREVLAATDFSELGDLAIPHALSLLTEGGTLHVAHVLSDSVAISRPTPPRVRPSPRDERVAEATERLRRLVPREAERRGIRVATHVLEGDVAWALCRAADRLAVDVVCMASRGRSTVGAAVLGSATSSVLAKSTRPVFVVRTPSS